MPRQARPISKQTHRILHELPHIGLGFDLLGIVTVRPLLSGLAAPQQQHLLWHQPLSCISVSRSSAFATLSRLNWSDPRRHEGKSSTSTRGCPSGAETILIAVSGTSNYHPSRIAATKNRIVTGMMLSSSRRTERLFAHAHNREAPKVLSGIAPVKTRMTN